MVDITLLIVGGLISALFTFLTSIALYQNKKNRETLETHGLDIVSLKSTSVTDEHVRKIVQEELKTVTNVLNPIATSVRNIEISMAQDRGYRAGLAQNKNKNEE